jgi:hypothetical protein
VDVGGCLRDRLDEEFIGLGGLDLAEHLGRGRLDEHDDVVAGDVGRLLLGVAGGRRDEDGAVDGGLLDRAEALPLARQDFRPGEQRRLLRAVAGKRGSAARRVDGGGHVEVTERRRLDKRDLLVLGRRVDDLQVHDRFLTDLGTSLVGDRL